MLRLATPPQLEPFRSCKRKVLKSYDESKEQTLKLSLYKALTPVLAFIILGIMATGMVEIIRLRMEWIEEKRMFMGGMVKHSRLVRERDRLELSRCVPMASSTW